MWPPNARSRTAIPGAEHRILEGQTHQVDPVVLGRALDDFLRA